MTLLLPDDRGMTEALTHFRSTATSKSWRDVARPDQLPPKAWTRTWLVRGGRGSGKTYCASNVLAELILASEPGEWAVVAPTFGDARDICIEGEESGLLTALGAKVGAMGVLRVKGPHVEQWNRTNGHLRLVNGSIVYIDGADDGAFRIQGHNLRGLWGDEVGLWRRWATAWDESIRYAVRLAPAKIVLSGTPKRQMPARAFVKKLLADDKVVKSRLLTKDNLANLDPNAADEFMASKGTALERQELEGELLNEAEGAMWRWEMIERNRVALPPPGLVRVVVGVDPAGGSKRSNDQTGIVACGTATDGELHGYVLADRSARLTPNGWASAAVGLYDEWKADRIVGERNYGGDMVQNTIRTIRPNVSYKDANASRGKQIRAEPIASLYERNRVHHVGPGFPELEDQMTQWVPGETEESPDRLDALVWALSDLMLKGGHSPVGWAPQGTTKTNPWAAELTG